MVVLVVVLLVIFRPSPPLVMSVVFSVFSPRLWITTR